MASSANTLIGLLSITGLIIALFLAIPIRRLTRSAPLFSLVITVLFAVAVAESVSIMYNSSQFVLYPNLMMARSIRTHFMIFVGVCCSFMAMTSMFMLNLGRVKKKEKKKLVIFFLIFIACQSLSIVSMIYFLRSVFGVIPESG